MGQSDQAAFGELKNHHTAWLSTLDATAEVEDLLLCHGTPDSDNTYLLETVEPDGKVRHRDACRGDAAARRHERARSCCAATATWRASSALDDGRLIVNPGSVGLPAYTDTEPVRHSMQMGAPHARYAVLERRKASEPWQISFRVVAYDWDAAAERAAAKGREDWARWIRTGYVRERTLTRRPSPPGSAPSRESRAASRAAAASTPSRSAMLTFAPASTSSRTISVCVGPPSPRITASSSAVQPSLLT